MKKLFGAYIHWPYCLSKCPYCDFASRAESPLDENTLFQAYRRDILFLRTKTSAKTLTSVFFGGGTPSLMSPSLCTRLLNELNAHFPFSSDIEITLEANPDAINLKKMKSFQKVGINRLSLGVQSMTESGLKQLGRRHSLKTALSQIENAQCVFKNINIDLIYARPHQTRSDWQQELETAYALNLPHYSCYQLSIEKGTPFASQKIIPTDDETARTLYLDTHDFMKTKNIRQYEVSNYAKSGFECRHNLTYWLGCDYLGIGPAAHGRLNNLAVQNARTTSQWIKQKPQIETLSETERQTEKLMMHLRLLNVGYPIQGLPEQGLRTAFQNKWIIQKGDKIFPTLEGILMLNSLILLLMPA